MDVGHCELIWGDELEEASHGRGAAIFSEFLTPGAQYLSGNMTSKKVVGPTRPTFLCAGHENNVLVKLLY